MKRIFFILVLIVTTLSAFSQVRLSNRAKSEKDLLNDKYCSGLFKTAEGTIFNIENENVGAYFNILDWLEGRVAGLQVFVSRNGVRVPVIRGSVSTVFVDEMRMDPSFLNSLSVHDIAMIKIIKGPFAGAPGNGAGGTVAIYTFRGEDEEIED